MEVFISDQRRLQERLSQLLSRHPSVFGDWFVRTFPDPQTWFMARLNYARTTAVMSMVSR